MKYLILLTFVILLPMFLVDAFGNGAPYFCKLICPAGTLGGALPLLAKNEGLRSTIGFLFFWKLSILIVVAALSIFTYRPFCKYICPLGALYSFFNKVGFYKMEFVSDKCVNCGLCERACKMDISVRANPNSLECIRCGACTAACRHGALTTSYAGFGKKKEERYVNVKACNSNCKGCANVE